MPSMALAPAGRTAQAALATGARVVHDYGAHVLLEVPDARGDGAEMAAAGLEILRPTISVNGADWLVPSGVFEGGGPHTLVRFIGPLTEEWRHALVERAVEIRFWCPPHGACVLLPDDLPPSEVGEAFWFVAGCQPYVEAQCRRPTADEPADPSTGLPRNLVDVVCFGRQARERVELSLRRDGYRVIDSASSKIRLDYEGDLRPLRALHGVKLVTRPRGAVTLAAPLAGAVGVAGGDGGWRPDLDAKGETIGIVDTGLDSGDLAALPRDLAGRVTRLVSWPVNPGLDSVVVMPGADDGPADRNTGHGTYIASAVAGDGSLSGGTHRGVAPGAKVVFQAIEQFLDVRPENGAAIKPGFYLSGRPLDLRDLFGRAAADGAVVHVNAWGDPAKGTYTDDCFEVDLYLSEHPEHLVLFASGNEGSDRDGNRVVDARTLYAPASAKNVIAVGACEGPAAGIGLRSTWTALERPGTTRFANAADRSDPVSGEPDRLALLTSAGPTTDGRRKPDVCAPGTNVVGLRSSVSPNTGWGIAEPQPHYCYRGGTSVAVAVAGGTAAVLRRAWRTRRRRAPSGPGLKALLLAGAAPVLGRGTTRPESPDACGWGRIHLEQVLPSPSPTASPFLREGRGDAVTTGEQRRYRLRMTDPGPVRVALTWYDLPNERLVHDLDLSFEQGDGTVTRGNHRPGEGGVPDRVNSAEVVDLALVPSGTHDVVVTGFNLPAGRQLFALAVVAPPGAALGRGRGRRR